MFGFGDPMFDFNGDGKLDVFEQAMEAKFIDEGIKFLEDNDSEDDDDD